MDKIEDIAVPFRTVGEYRAAIASLEASTRATEDHIDASRKFLDKVSHQKNGFTAPHRPQAPSEQQQISSLINTLRNNTQDGHSTLSEKLHKKLSTTLITISDTLRRHDYDLEQLETQEQSARTATEHDGEHEENLLDALQNTHSETIRTRLDRIYLDSSAFAGVNGHANGEHPSSKHESDDVQGNKLNEVQSDLRSLHAEIDDVTQMLVMHEHGDQLLAALDKLDDAREHLLEQQAQQAVDRLTAMADQLTEMSAHCELLQSQRIVQQRLGAHLHSVKGSEMSLQGTAGPRMKYNARKQDGPAIAALRQYLSLGDDIKAGTQRDEQVKHVFEEYVAQVQTAMESQLQQADYLQPHQEKRRESEAAVPNVPVSARSPQLRLDMLDQEIAAIKQRMESLRT
ncbi:hypothetical protein H2198_010694 [Neophaeococcomyces mojaviensis]|uniref:Uncharacterized protein n=1 Tax=Neophaeococcomyces mojaviensis TaxID=3383035 RepID=A0ACC2ZQX4_9EURO|nr:hypothetical protein H2198_010694 [Knufia sp. JES_112]